MITPIAFQMINTPNGVVEVPIYHIEDVADSSYRIETANGLGCYYMVEPSSGTVLRVMTSTGIKGISIELLQSTQVVENLILHYDFRGKTNLDEDLYTIQDLSPSEGHTGPSNFFFNEVNGYTNTDGLYFTDTAYNYVYKILFPESFESGSLVAYFKPFRLGEVGENYYSPSVLSNIVLAGGTVSGYTVSLFEDYFLLEYGDSNGQLASVEQPYTSPLNQWTHLAVTYQDNVFKVYVNGQLVLTHIPMAGIRYARKTFVVGNWENNTPIYPFSGVVAYAKVFDRAITLQEVSLDYKLKDITTA